MSISYKSVFFFEHSEGASHHTLDKLDHVLNDFGKQDYRLIQMRPLEIGYLLVFEHDDSSSSRHI